MKLDINLIRNLLLFAEEQPEDSILSQSQLNEFANKHGYSTKVLIYHLERLDEANYIDVEFNYADNDVYSYHLNYITYDGHEFLGTIKPTTVWEKTKGTSKALGMQSMNAIKEIAIKVTSDIISNHFK